MLLKEFAKADHEIGDSGVPLEPPKGFDMAKFDRGRKFLQDHAFSNAIALIVSLTCGLSVQNLLEPLVFTKQSDTPKKAFKRYEATYVHLTRWVYGNIWDKTNRGYKSIMAVRSIHNKVRKDMMEHQSQQKNSEVCTDENGSKMSTCPMATKEMRLSQYDMSLVQCGFIGSLLLYPKSLGIHSTDNDLDDLTYFWYGVGYALGITDKNNICRDGYKTTKAICKEIEQDILLPALRDPPKDFHKMAFALLDGIKVYGYILSFIFSFPSVLAMGYYGMGEELPEMNFTDYLRYLMLRMVINTVYYLPFLNKFHNNVIKYVYWDSNIMIKKHKF